MANTLTIVARNPKGKQLGTFDGSTEDNHIRQFLLHLDSPARPATHRVARASTVADVIAILKAHTDPLDTLQLIGHAVPGRLFFGEGNWTKPPPAKDTSYRLDSNFLTYGPLLVKVRPPTEVFLLGCSVGDCVPVGKPTPIGHAPDDGAALLHDLAHMWSCVVKAPVDGISSLDLDAGGLFVDTIINGKSRLSKADGQSFVVGTPPPSPPIGPSPPMNVVLRRMTSGRGLGGVESIRVPLEAGEGAELAAALTRRIGRAVTTDAFSLPEYTFDATVGVEPWTAAVYNNGRLLRLTRDGASFVHRLDGPDEGPGALALLQAMHGLAAA